jgi:hypothetical protein
MDLILKAKRSWIIIFHKFQIPTFFHADGQMMKIIFTAFAKPNVSAFAVRAISTFGQL